MRQLSQQEFLALPDAEKLAEIRRRGLDRDPAIQEKLAQLAETYERNPLQKFRPNSDAQRDFLAALTRTVAAIAGNQFGKTTSLVVKSLIQCLPSEWLPKSLLPFKRFDGAVQGRIVCPSYALVEQNLVPTFREWCPKEALRKGGFEHGWNSQAKVLSFANGSFIDFLTYETDLDKFGGVRRHFVAYDEPPPQLIRDEGLRAIMRYGGFEMMAFTPLKVNTGWLRREVLKKRESPDVTVVRGSIHDNQALDPAARDYFLSSLPNDLWRRAREFGDFVEVGGLIYPDFERRVLPYELTRDFVQGLDVVVGIDPGIRNAGIVWVGFDNENVAWVFSEALLQDKVPRDYVERIRQVNAFWGLKDDDVQYVCDPAARQRGQVNAETVLSQLTAEGIYAAPGQNDVDAGLGQLRTRMQYERFHVDPRCRGLREEADDYAAEEPDEGKDDSQLKPVKGNDHRLDALRYAVMERFWDPVMEEQAPQRNLGWKPGRAPAYSEIRPQREAAPLGFMS